MIKILHTADIHLDAPFAALDARHAEIRRNELRAAFTSMMTYAKMQAVDLLLIAGDLFDGALVTRETIALLCREFEGFGKPVFITPGNHDPATPKSVWLKNPFPPNVHIFTDEVLSSVSLDTLGVTVYGFGFRSADMDVCPLDGLTVDDPARINLLVCHGDLIGSNSTDCPLTEATLTAFGADYTALGHIHNPTEAGSDNRWSYPGCLEPRGFDECGPKGACLVEIDKRRAPSVVNLRRVRFSKRRYERATLVLDHADTVAAVTEAIDACIRENKYGEDTLLALRLTGTTAPALLLNTEELSAGHALFSLTLTDDTTPALDPDALAHDVSIRGEVYRQLAPALASDDEREREVARRALRYAFSALAGEKAF